jgi:hypothetical protein
VNLIDVNGSFAGMSMCKHELRLRGAYEPQPVGCAGGVKRDGPTRRLNPPSGGLNATATFGCC